MPASSSSPKPAWRKATVAPPSLGSMSQRTVVPTQWGGNVSVRQTTVESSDCSSRRSNGAGATANSTFTVSPTSAGTAARLVQKPLIPSVVLIASSTVSGGASTSKRNSTSVIGDLLSFKWSRKRTIHFTVG